VLYYIPLHHTHGLLQPKRRAVWIKDLLLKKHLLFVGNTFALNRPLQRYIIRDVEKDLGSLDCISFFSESDKSLFLELETKLQKPSSFVIVSTKNSFAVVGKLLSTITGDNLVLKDEMLIPSKSRAAAPHSYLLHYKEARINVLLAHENEKLPVLLLAEPDKSALIHLFGEEIESAKVLLAPLAQTYDVRLDFTELVRGWLQVRVLSRGYGDVAQFVASSKQLMPHNIITSQNIMAHIIERLQANSKKVTFAESCTGGMLASLLTKESGASNVFDGSLVTYANALKANWLAVEALKLERYGAVSSEVVDEMSEGALSVSEADFALAVSGVAGPDGGTDEKPVGTVYIGVRTKTHNLVERLSFSGDRNYIQEQSAFYAVKMLLLSERTVFF
jgi:nicotinamide-nucleotide amidase